MKTINIAIDGPAGAGKSSIAREVASQLGFVYVDTGALYRAIALFSTEYQTRKDFLDNLEEHCHLELKYFGGTQCIFLNDENVTEKIRTPEISMKASEVSALPEVREFLLETQKDIAREFNVIMDGRDIGTVVLPDADLKIYLTASAEERASRRWRTSRTSPPMTRSWRTSSSVTTTICTVQFRRSNRQKMPSSSTALPWAFTRSVRRSWI